MEKLFEVIRIPGGKDQKNFEVCIGIRMKVGGSESVFPITRPCRGFADLEQEALILEKDLSSSIDRAKSILANSMPPELPEITPDMRPEEIWACLSQIEGEDLFIRGFNSLEEERRKVVAEYVLTRCNIFSGKASIFSSRYNSETALME